MKTFLNKIFGNKIKKQEVTSDYCSIERVLKKDVRKERVYENKIGAESKVIYTTRYDLNYN